MSTLLMLAKIIGFGLIIFSPIILGLTIHSILNNRHLQGSAKIMQDGNGLYAVQIWDYDPVDWEGIELMGWYTIEKYPTLAAAKQKMDELNQEVERREKSCTYKEIS